MKRVVKSFSRRLTSWSRMSSPSSIQSFDTNYPADSLEFCPISDYQDYFVCGTYYLQKDEQPQDSTDNDNAFEQSLQTNPPTTTEQKKQIRLGKCWLFLSESKGNLWDVSSYRDL